MRIFVIEIFATDIRGIAPHLDSLQKTLCPARQAAAARYVLEPDRLRCVAGGLVQRAVLGTDNVQISPSGKPFLPDGAPFNLSHSGDYVVFATAARPVGVDIERIRKERFEALARVAFHPEECAALRAAQDQTSVFFALWTLKESYMKADGRGFSMGSKGFEIRLSGDSAYLAGDLAHHFYRFFELPGYALAACSTDDACVPKIKMLAFSA